MQFKLKEVQNDNNWRPLRALNISFGLDDETPMHEYTERLEELLNTAWFPGCRVLEHNLSPLVYVPGVQKKVRAIVVITAWD